MVIMKTPESTHCLFFFQIVKAGAGHTTHPFLRKTPRLDGFTYAEMMMALSILALAAASTFAAMSQANRFAITNRV
jgi:prepilin-type N-terminal cleavage/methylation domain-containing protein